MRRQCSTSNVPSIQLRVVELALGASKNEICLFAMSLLINDSALNELNITDGVLVRQSTSNSTPIRYNI